MTKKFKLKEKIKSIYFEVFTYTFQIIITNSISESYRNKFGYYFDGKGLSGLVVSLNNNSLESCIFLKEDSTADTIAHECYHAIKRLEIKMGEKSGEEWFAYHLGYLVGEVHKFIK